MIRVIIGFILLAIVLFIGFEFSTINSDPVDVNYFIGSLSVPLSLVMVSAFTVGVLVAILVVIGVIMKLRWRVSRLQREVSVRDHELGTLRNQTRSAR